MKVTHHIKISKSHNLTTSTLSVSLTSSCFIFALLFKMFHLPIKLPLKWHLLGNRGITDIRKLTSTIPTSPNPEGSRKLVIFFILKRPSRSFLTSRLTMVHARQNRRRANHSIAFFVTNQKVRQFMHHFRPKALQWPMWWRQKSYTRTSWATRSIRLRLSE